MNYDEHAMMTRPAMARSEAWRTAAGFVAIAVATGFLNAGFYAVVDSVAPQWSRTYLQGAGLGQTPISLLVVLLSFGLAIIAVAATLRILHGRGLSTAMGPLMMVVRDFLACLKILVPIIFLFALIPSPEGQHLIPHLSFGTWIMLLPFALVGLIIQVGSEEILFRGYLQQQLAARFANPAVWLLVPSTLFALGHYDPNAGAVAGYVIIWALLFGVAAGDLTARAGNLGPAIAMHFVNNAMAMLIVSLPDSLSGLALYHYPYTTAQIAEASPLMLFDLVHLLISWLACRVAIRR